MTTYTASANQTGITLTRTGLAAPRTLAWTNFQDQMTSLPLASEQAFRESQTLFNYFDSIKDGTSGLLQNSLGIYLPVSANANGVALRNRAPRYQNNWNPTGSNIKNMRNEFTHKYVANIKPESWLKLKNSDNLLDPKKQYGFHFWDAGMTADRILKSGGGGPSIQLASIGTLIDPASGKTEGKISADVVAGTKQLFPRAGNSIAFDWRFMNAIGFSGDSKIRAVSQTVSGGGGGAVPFQYTMNVGCGTACGGNDTCVIANTGGGRALPHYTIGNNAKGSQIASLSSSPADTREKVKYIVLKEWGDKMQVMCHLMNYYLGPNGQHTTLLTNDFPVFCLCINFQIPCIFTGQTEKKVSSSGIYKPILPDFKERRGEAGEDMSKKAYGILTFVPGDPVDTLCRNILQIRDNIYRENDLFLQGVTQIRSGMRRIKLGGSDVILSDEYWDIMIADIGAINTMNARRFGAPAAGNAIVNFGAGWWDSGVCPALGTNAAFGAAWVLPHSNRAQRQVRNSALGEATRAFIEEMKKQAYIKRVVKNVKYTANGGRNRGTNSLKLMRFKTYTGPKSSQGGYTFGFSQNTPLVVGRNFSEWALQYRTRQGGGAKMKGGMNGASTGETKQPVLAPVWTFFPGDFQGPVWYYEGEDDETTPNLDQKNLTKELFDNLILPLYKGSDSWGKATVIDEYNGIVATIYSQYCYESWIDGQATTVFTNHNTTIRNLLTSCELHLSLISAFRLILNNSMRQSKSVPRMAPLRYQRQGRGEERGISQEIRSTLKTMRRMKAARMKKRGQAVSGRRGVGHGGKKKTRKKKRRKRKKTRRRRRKKHKRKTRRKR